MYLVPRMIKSYPPFTSSPQKKVSLRSAPQIQVICGSDRKTQKPLQRVSILVKMLGYNFNKEQCTVE